MMTFFGLGVLARSLVSDEMWTAGTGGCESSPSELRPIGMEATFREAPFVIIDGRPPCVGQAELRVVVTATAGLLTPGTSLPRKSVVIQIVVPGRVTRSRLTLVRRTWQE